MEKKEKVKDLDRKSGFLRKSWAVRKGQIPVRSKNSRAEGRSLEGGKEGLRRGREENMFTPRIKLHSLICMNSSQQNLVVKSGFCVPVTSFDKRVKIT